MTALANPDSATLKPLIFTRFFNYLLEITLSIQTTPYNAEVIYAFQGFLKRIDQYLTQHGVEIHETALNSLVIEDNALSVVKQQGVIALLRAELLRGPAVADLRGMLTTFQEYHDTLLN